MGLKPLDAMSVRDFIAWTVVTARAFTTQIDDIDVASAFQLADRFIDQSHGHWAVKEVKEREERGDERAEPLRAAQKRGT